MISAVPNADGTVAATARLIVDPSATHPAASFADESLVLSPKDGGGYVVSSLTAGQLKDEPIGPQVRVGGAGDRADPGDAGELRQRPARRTASPGRSP